ncbi:ERI1 exoribonuclease 2-like [Bradysia coprophila]|uniref:ERI1 exoribonuclease 2-like n=1 Tax=Bradysia coprophila TaxID=38358 RepID=UPI00187D7485|nr:ERI1 exoribonuclease 2-like [Bradysia coprophila]
MAEYLICLDFEATCYPSKNQRNKGWYQEIVDIGAALINLNDGDIESAFQCNVNTTEFFLTYGCKKKLGLDQDYLDGCPTLPSVLGRFCKWTKYLRDEHDLIMPWNSRSDYENTYFCTWSNMDLGYFLPNECSQKNISYANYLKYWINGQEIFNEYIFGRNAKLHDAADYVGTKIVGDAHGAADDAKTLAYLMHDIFDNNNVNFEVKSCR